MNDDIVTIYDIIYNEKHLCNFDKLYNDIIVIHKINKFAN